MYPDPNMPDPRAALAAYGAPPPQQPVISDQDLLNLDVSQVGPAQGPDPRAALSAYMGQPMPATSQQALGQVGNAIADQQASESLRAQVAQDAADQASAVQAEAATDAAMQADEIRQAREEHKGEVAQILDDGEDMGERSTMSKVMSAVAVAMGGVQDHYYMTAGMGKADNAKQISDMINTQIDRDISLRREKLANRRNASDQGYAENTQALQLAHAAKIEQAQMALQSIASQAKSEDAQASSLGAIARLEEKKQALFGDALQQREAAKARAAAANKPKAIDWGRDFTPEQLKAMAAAGVLPADGHAVLKGIAPDKEEKWSRTGELTGYTATQELSAGDMAEARKIDAATRSLEKDYDALAALRRKNNGATWDRTDMNEAERIIDSMPAKFSQTFGSGAPSQQEMERFEKSLVNPTDVHLLKDPEEVYRRGKQSIRDNATVKLDSYGFKPGGDNPVLPAGVQEKLDALHSKHSFRPTGK